MRVMAYIRTSGLSQVDKDGPLRQRDAILAFAATHKLELQLSDIYEEKGVSGTTECMARPAFSTMFMRVTQLREAGVEIVGFVCERLDRLARDLHISELLLAQCRKNNLAVFCAEQGDLRDVASDGNDPMRVMLRQFLGAISQFQKSELVKKLALARARKCAETGYCGGIPPFGSKPGEGPCLVAIGQMVKEGKSYGEIAKTLNDTGFRTRAGGTFSRQHIRKQVVTKKLDIRRSEAHYTPA